MEYQWNIIKATSNIAKHGVSFESASSFDWTNAMVLEDTRKDYNERRFLAVSYIGDQLYSMVFTRRNEQVRIINLHLANKKMRENYHASTK